MIFVEILHTNQYLWSVHLVGCKYWLEVFLTRKEAVEYCLSNGYRIKR